MRTRAPLVVGRDQELHELGRAVAETSVARGTSMFVVGEAGIGKSRLAAEAAGRAFAGGVRVLRGRSSTIGPTTPFRPLAEALMSVFRSGLAPDVAELGPYRPVLGRLAPDWNHGEPPAGDDSLIVLAEAVLRLTAILGKDHGCLLVLEDLQAADAETLAVVEYLVDNLDGVPVMLLATVRAEPCAAIDLAGEAARRGAATILELRRLELADVRRLVGSCLEIALDDVPERVAERLWRDSAGNPFMVEELLNGMVDSGQLLGGPDGWREVAELRTEVPSTLVRSIADRVDRLGPRGRALLSVAAVLGHRFPLSVVQQVTGMDDRALLSHLHAGVAARLVTADEPAPEWYAFQHPLTREALLAMITPTDRAELSRQAADGIETLHPDLPGEWCQLAASLRLATGDNDGAARLLAEAGRRALADGAASSAVTLLEQAAGLLTDAGARAEVLEALLYSLAEAGRFTRAYELIDQLDRAEGTRLDTSRRAALHVRLAYVARLAGSQADALAQISAARALLGPAPADADAAPLDAVAAELTIEQPGRDRLREAEKLARRAIAAAERVPLPAIACQAWVTVGTVARERDLAESNACLERSRRLAEENRLPIWRIHAMFDLARNDWLSTGDVASLENARQEALRVGAITVGYWLDASIAMHLAMCGRYEEAAGLAEACWTAAKRLRLDYVAMYIQMTKAVIAAHQGRRAELDAAMAEFRRRGGEHETPEYPLLLGMASAVCALLEEDHDRARHELDQVQRSEEDNPTFYSLAGRHGLKLLVDVLHGVAHWPQYKEVTEAVPGGMRWNRQFVLLAHAVLLGQSGRCDEATAAAEEAQQVATIYPMTRNLGLRLVAPAAAADGWGAPETWLRGAEEYFHQATVPAVASACRGLLRQTGASVRQRRAGTEALPTALRALGVTVREYEVFRLLADRLGNKAIGARLHISPRTVEKHVASLVTKIGVSDREALHDFAATMPADPGR